MPYTLKDLSEAQVGHLLDGLTLLLMEKEELKKVAGLHRRSDEELREIRKLRDWIDAMTIRPVGSNG